MCGLGSQGQKGNFDRCGFCVPVVDSGIDKDEARAQEWQSTDRCCSLSGCQSALCSSSARGMAQLDPRVKGFRY